MNIVLFENSEVEPTTGEGMGMLRLQDRRARHLTGVLNVEPGDTIRLGEINGGVGRGLVVERSDERGTITLEIQELATQQRVLREINLIVAVCRPQSVKKILQVASSYCVKSISFINAFRVEQSYFNSRALTDENIEYEILLGLEQSTFTRKPIVSCYQQIKPKDIARILSPLVAADLQPLKLVCHLDNKVPHLGGYPELSRAESYPCPSPVVCAIGPEGGWTEQEYESLIECGFRGVRLGEAVHRVETAVTVLLAKLELLAEIEGNR